MSLVDVLSHIDMVWISRVQFAMTAVFHIIFPSFSIGLATFLMVMEGLWLKTKRPVYLSICLFWNKIFALTFGMGVVSGVAIGLQFGMNWAGMTQMAGSALGALLTYEVMTAFFVEAGFLGVMVFGWRKVSPKAHFFATCMVVLGVTLSAFWILAANSWMQTPDGVVFENGVAVVTDWMKVIFNPSFLPRYIHMMMASYMATATAVMGVSAFFLFRDKHHEVALTALKFCAVTLLILSLLQFFVGDSVGLVVHEHQPLKTAAIEGVWDTTAGAPLLLFAWPDMASQSNWWTVSIPYGASLINTHSLDGVLVGLKTVPRDMQPYVPLVFWSFRLMVGCGLLMLALAATVSWQLIARRAQALGSKLQIILMMAGPVGFLAIVLGWFTAETGRQPWTIYGILKTTHAASPITFHEVLVSFLTFLVVYGFVFGIGYTYYFFKTLRHGPMSGQEAVDSLRPKMVDPTS